MVIAKRSAKRALVLGVYCGVALAGACDCCGAEEQQPCPKDLPAHFARNRADFEWLKDILRSEPAIPNLHKDRYEWTEPCEDPGCSPRSRGLPPGETARPCPGAFPCGRYRQGPPTPEIISAIGLLPLPQAQQVWEAARRTGATHIQRYELNPTEVEFTMCSSGIIPSGSSTSIEWREGQPPSPWSTGSAHKGSTGEPLGGQWFVVRRWN